MHCSVTDRQTARRTGGRTKDIMMPKANHMRAVGLQNGRLNLFDCVRFLSIYSSHLNLPRTDGRCGLSRHRCCWLDEYSFNVAEKDDDKEILCRRLFQRRKLPALILITQRFSLRRCAPIERRRSINAGLLDSGRAVSQNAAVFSEVQQFIKNDEDVLITGWFDFLLSFRRRAWNCREICMI